MTNEENWAVIKDKGVWGVPKNSKKQIETAKMGDQVVFYVTPKTIRGIFEVLSDPFESNEVLFEWDEFGKEEIFPHRIKLKRIHIANTPVIIDALVPKLQFIKYKVIYSVHLRKAMQEIPKEDFELISKYLTRQ